MTYFYHPKHVRIIHFKGRLRVLIVSLQRVFTDANLYKDDVSSRINNYIGLVFDFIRAHQIVLPLDADLVLDYIDNPEPEDGGESDTESKGLEPQTEIVYYFADRKSKYTFWLDSYNLAPLYDEIRGEEESEETEHPHSHISMFLEIRFLFQMFSLSFRILVGIAVLVRICFIR